MSALGASSSPFGVAVAANSQWAFVSLGDSLGVLRLSGAHGPQLIRRIAVPGEQTLGDALTPDGRYVVVADGLGGAAVVSVAAAERGSPHAVLGTLSSPGQRLGGAIEVAVSPDGGLAFASLEDTGTIAVFNLAAALAGGFGPSSYLGSIPVQTAPVGLAVSPDGRWLYATSEGEPNTAGVVQVISVARAETDPSAAVVSTVSAGCSPVRVITSADGSVVWVTARASDAVLAFSASRLRTDRGHALLADVPVGEAPVGLALVRRGTLLVIADSDRFDVAGQSPSLAVVDVADALAERAALLGYLPAGGFPRDMAAEPDGRALLVANFTSRQLEAVDTADLP
jgi:DNA-binding beta-propeller fold protein YncE